MVRPKLSSRVVRLSVSIDEATYSDLCAIADAAGVSAAWAVRRSIAEWLEHHKEELPHQMFLLPVGSTDAHRSNATNRHGDGDGDRNELAPHLGPGTNR
jgi:hypothetical protein